MRFGIMLACALGLGLVSLRADADELSAPEADSPIKFEPLSLSSPLMMADGSSTTRPAYKGGRGMITMQGMTGMFMNPTSGTLDQGQLTIQYCLFINGYNAGTVVGHGLMVSYGVTDYLEVGWFSNIAEIQGVNRSWCDNPILVTGPFARVRLTKEEGWMPEISVGGIWLDGNEPGDLLARSEVFIAASKHWDIEPNGFFKSVRVHGGFRYISRQEAPNLPKSVRLGTDLSTLYGGVEIEMPYSIYLIGEVATPDLFSSGQNEAWPYAVGIQWRPTNVLGISVAHMNPEDLGLRDGFWFGIGLNFKF